MINVKLDNDRASIQSAIKVKANKLDLLFHQSFPGSVASALAGGLLAYILKGQLSDHLLWIWLFSIVSAALGGFLFFIRYKQVAPTGTNILRWEKPYYFNMVYGVLAWGAGGMVLMSQVPLLYQAVIYIFLVALTGGALSSFCAIPKFTVTAIVSILTPGTILFLTNGDSISVPIGLAGAIFIISGFYFIDVLSKVMHRSFFLTHALARAKEEAEKTARTDALTGINNRRAFYQYAATQIEYCHRNEQPVSLVLLDIDNFKQINDNLGHDAGDEAIKKIAETLLSSIRASDFCGRIGGEEFAVLLCNTTLNDALNVAENIKEAIASTLIKVGKETIRVTASIGVSSSKGNIDEILKMADMAMYRAKRMGKNRVERYDIIGFKLNMND